MHWAPVLSRPLSWYQPANPGAGVGRNSLGYMRPAGAVLQQNDHSVHVLKDLLASGVVQLVADGRGAADRRGMMSEQWMNTDWTQARGSLLALAHSWCAGLVLHAADDTAGFGDVVVELDRAEAVALGAVGLEALPLAGGLPPRLHNPWPRGSSPLKPGQRREVLVTDAGRAVTRPALDTLRPRAPVPGPGRPAPSPRPAERPRPDRTAACH